MKEERYIDKVFKEKLSNFEKTPPDGIWSSISASLLPARRKIMIVLAWKIAAGFAILLSTGLGWYFLQERNNTLTAPTAETIKNERTEQAPEPIEGLLHHKLESFSSIDDTLKVAATTTLPDISRESDLTAYSIESEYPSAKVSTSNQIATKDLNIVGFSISLDIPEQITAPRANKEMIKRKKSHPTVSWDMLFSGISEDEKPFKDENRQWLLAAIAAPEYSYRTVKDAPMAPSTYFNNTENPRISYSGGLQLGYQVNKRLNIQSGIIYSRSGIEINQLNSLGSIALERNFGSGSVGSEKSLVNIGNSMGLINPSNPNLTYLSYNQTNEELIGRNQATFDNLTGSEDFIYQINAELIQYFDFVELPLNLRYQVYDGRINLNVIGGMSSNVLVGNKVIFKSDGEKMENGRTENIRTFNYSGNLGFSVDYEISNQFLLLLEPRYKKHLRSINQEGFLDARPYMFGIFTGVRYRF